MECKILWAMAAILLCTLPCSAEDISIEVDVPPNINDIANVYDGGILNVSNGGTVTGPVNVYGGGIVNIYPGGTVLNGINVIEPQCEVNIYGVGLLFGQLYIDSLDAAVSIHGTSFVLKDSYGVILDDTTEPKKIIIETNFGFGTLDWQYNGTTYSIDFAAGEVEGAEIILSEPPTSIEVHIDIKPGSDPNPINPGSNGLIPVAILTTDDFDAADVDPGTVTLAGANVAVRGKAEKLMARLEDVDDDDDLDLLVQVDTQSDGAVWTSGPVTLTGKTYDEQDIEGTDEVIIVPPKE